jgi:glycosyltransferase involved in cell wall biosynthesis
MTLSILGSLALNRLKPIDLVHGIFVHFSGYSACVLARLLRKPVVTTVHDSHIYERAEASPGDLERGRAVFTVRQSDRIITVSAAQMDAVIKLGANPKRVCVITNGVDVRRFQPVARAQARLALGLPPDGNIVLYVGRIVKHKGLVYLVEAIKRLESDRTSVLCHVAGDGDFRPDLAELIAAHDLRTKMILHGALPHADLPLWMNAADVLALPSLREGWPTVLFEAFACGTPVVATRVGGVPEAVCSPDFGLLVEPGDSVGLAAALDEALHRNWDRTRMVEYARENSWRSKAEQTCAVYSRVLGTTVGGE